MPQIPSETGLDHTYALMSEAYEFIPRRCRKYGSDVFETRLMLHKAVCMSGEEAARAFYHPQRFTRKRAMPPTTLRLLQGPGSVQVLDGEAHRVRKAMFMSMMEPGSIQRLCDIMADHWRAEAPRWEGRRLVLFPEVQGILCRAVCDWAGLPLSRPEADRRTRDFAAMIDGAGAAGPRNWRGMLLRKRTERWAERAIADLRSGRRSAPKGSAAEIIATHRDSDGSLLPADVAAVELLNVLRPTVAVGHFIIFAAHALHRHPDAARQVREGDDAYNEMFVQEVRRFYPFFPAVSGYAREPFEVAGHRFPAGTWALLDLYGTNHDRRSWGDPEAFRPERFSAWDGNAFSLIPQGGGSFDAGHRCPGEWMTIELTKRAVAILARAMHYDVPEQDLAIRLSRMPAVPESRFIVENPRWVG